jgi:hypothetical protein
MNIRAALGKRFAKPYKTIKPADEDMLLAKVPYNRGASCDLDTVVARLRAGTAP